MSISNYLLHIVRAVLAWTPNKVGVAVTSTGWFVANNDTKTADSDIDDPQEAIELGTKAFAFDCKGMSFIDLYHFYVGTDPADDVKVRAFGFWPADGSEGAGKGVLLPKQVSASYPAADAAHIGGGYWAPLFAPVASGTHEQTLHTGSAAPDVTNNDSAITYKVKGKATYGTDGCTIAIVLVSDANTTTDVGLVLAHVGN